MMFQQINLCLVMSIVNGIQHASSSSKQSQNLLASSASSLSNPIEADNYRGLYEYIPVQAGDSVRHRVLKGEITRQCYNTLVASATNGKLRKQNYFIFTDGMSNGYYSFHNMTEFGDLPLKNKFGFNTLSCQCHSFGGSGNCCQGERAHIDVTGIENQDGIDAMDNRLRGYVSDICRVTNDAIGDDKLPPTGEIQATKWPTKTPSSQPTIRPSSSMFPSNIPTISKSPSLLPSSLPSSLPSVSIQPSGTPSYSLGPSAQPSSIPSGLPSVSIQPSGSPSYSLGPSAQPSSVPSSSPSISIQPSGSPSYSLGPSLQPTSDVGDVEAIVAPPTEEVNDGGLSVGAWSAIAIAAAAVIALGGYIAYDKKKGAVEKGIHDIESQQRDGED
ncbi:hypothetical protein ACHAWF_008607 [Thalassiosira exigua]